MSEKTRLSLKELIGAPFELELPDGTILDVPQPSVKNMLLLTDFAGQMQQAEQANDTKGQLEAFKNFEATLQAIVPQIKDFDLNLEQAFALMMTLQEEAMPKKMKMLEEKGIKLDPKEVDL